MTEKMTKWQPIEAADLDECEAVILWLPDYGDWVKGCWWRGQWVDFETLDPFESSDGDIDEPTYFISGPLPPAYFEGK